MEALYLWGDFLEEGEAFIERLPGLSRRFLAPRESNFLYPLSAAGADGKGDSKDSQRLGLLRLHPLGFLDLLEAAQKDVRGAQDFGQCEDTGNPSPEDPRLRTRSVRFASIFRKCDLELQRCFCAGIMICRGPDRFALLPCITRHVCGKLSKDIITYCHRPVI